MHLGTSPLAAAFLPLALALVTACTPPDDGNPLGDGSTSGDGGTTADGGATGDGGADGDTGAVVEGAIDVVSIEFSEEHQTVATITWTSDQPIRGRARLPTGQLTPLEDEYSLEHRTVLLGLPPDADLEIHLLGKTEGGDTLQEGVEIETGPLKGTSPLVDVEFFGDPTPGYTVVTLLGDENSGLPGQVLILDASGHIVWRKAFGFINVTSATLDPARSAVVANVGAAVVRVPLLGGDVTGFNDMVFHHQTVILPDGRMATLREEDGTLDGYLVTADAIVELADDRAPRVVWDAFEDLGQVGVNVGDHTGAGPAGLTLTHANSLTYDEANDWYIVGMPGIESLVAIERSTGQVAWAISEPLLALDAEDVPYTLTHQVSLTDDGGMLLFVNSSETDPCARTVRLDLQPDALVESQVFDSIECPVVLGLGGVDALPDGRRLTSWSYLGLLEETDADNNVIMRADFGSGVTVGYVQHVTSLYPVD